MEAMNPFLRSARPAWAALPEPDRETGMVAPDISSPARRALQRAIRQCADSDIHLSIGPTFAGYTAQSEKAPI